MHRSAFTLVELMVVVVIIGVMSTLALPYLSGASRAAALDAAGDDLTQAMRYLQRQAVLRQRAYRLVLVMNDAETGRSGWRAEAAATDLDAAETWAAVTEGAVKPTWLDPAVTIGDLLREQDTLDPTPAVVFRADGTADAAVVVLALGERAVSVVVSPTDGRVTRVEGRADTVPGWREDLDE